MANPTQSITEAQVQELALCFHDLADAIEAYRLARGSALSSEYRDQLLHQMFQCIRYASTFSKAGLSRQRDTLVSTLESVKQVTAQAREAISTSDAVDQILLIVTAVSALGASLAGGDPSAIESRIQGVIASAAGDGSVASRKSEPA